MITDFKTVAPTDGRARLSGSLDVVADLAAHSLPRSFSTQRERLDDLADLIKAGPGVRAVPPRLYG